MRILSVGIVRASHDSCNNAPVSLAGIDTLANQFEASVTSTGSRYVDSVSTPCAFVLSHKGEGDQCIAFQGAQGCERIH